MPVTDEQRPLYACYKFFAIERFLEEVNGAGHHRTHRKSYIAMPRYNDDGQQNFPPKNLFLELKAGHIRHSNVENKAPAFDRLVSQKRARRFEIHDDKKSSFQQAAQGCPDSRIVIDNDNGLFAGQ